AAQPEGVDLAGGRRLLGGGRPAEGVARGGDAGAGKGRFFQEMAAGNTCHVLDLTFRRIGMSRRLSNSLPHRLTGTKHDSRPLGSNSPPTNLASSLSLWLH